MKKKGYLRYVLAVVLTGILFVTSSCTSFSFEDVSADAKYYDDVKVVSELGLMTGKNKSNFAPEETLTYGDIAAIAAKLHVLKTDSEPVKEQGDVWYQAYVEYCKANSIIFKEYNWQDSVSRAECIDILSRAVQDSDLNEKNYIADGAIPDVSESSEYYNSIYKFYRAGVFQGVDKPYNCDPEGFIYRYEVAEILNRIINPSERYSFALVSNSEDTEVDDNEIQYEDIIIMQTPIGNLYYPGKWMGKVSSQTVSVNKGYIAEIYGKTDNSSLLLATFYIGTEQEDGMFLGYVNESAVRVNIENPDLSGWAEEDRVSVYGMKEDINYILKQIMANPGYESTIDKDDNHNKDNANTDNTDNHKPNQGSTNTDNTGNTNPNQSGTSTDNTDNNKPNQGSTSTDNTDNNKPNQGGTDSDNTNPNQGSSGTDNTDNTKPNQGSSSTDNNKPNQGDNENVDAPDFVLLNTSIGTIYYPGRWTGKVLATPVTSSQGNVYDIYCKTNSGTVKLYTIYINSGKITGILVGYVDNAEIRIEIENSALAGWSESDKETYYNMQDTVNDIIEQIMSMPGYKDFISVPDNPGSTEDPNGGSDYNEELNNYIPWENGGKLPSEYTWAEFEALNPGQQMKFQEFFGSIDLFEAWRQRVQGDSSEGDIYLPWENGGKQPSEYTWAEFEALDLGQQMKFQEFFGSIDLFEAWRQRVQGDSSEDNIYLPWENGGKQPSEYTWAEFEALDPGQQMKFQEFFGSIDLFEAWRQRVQGGSSEGDIYLPWENGSKQPSEYTWAEFEALDPGQQMKFQEFFGSIDLFEAWRQRAQGESSESDLYLPWEYGGKQPPEYTWAEFEALDPGQQMKFQEFFGSIDLFEAWRQRVQGESFESDIYLPWEYGGKQPPEYTWAEFEALDFGQQFKFQEYFGNIDLFDEWRLRVQP